MTKKLDSRRRTALLGVMLVTTTLVSACLTYTTRAAMPGALTFRASFLRGLVPWQATGGGAQCANEGTPSTAPRLRGNFSTTRIQGVAAGRFDLPASQPGFPLQACELTHPRPLGLGTDDYYGYMFYVPRGWSTGSRAFWGVTTAQFHFQNIWGAPIEFALHRDHMTLGLETGACRNYRTVRPGCTWRSNADNPDRDAGNLGPRYVVPRPMRLGVWHELIMRVHWAADASGRIEVWHRVEGDPNWTRTVNLSGFPTVQWDAEKGCCSGVAVDKIGAYRGEAVAPVAVWEANFTIGTGFRVVADTMPDAPAQRKQPRRRAHPRKHRRHHHTHRSG